MPGVMPLRINLENRMKPIEKEELSQQTRDWYKEYYQKKGQDRNDLLTNPEVLFQHLAFEDAIISALRKATNLNRESSRILDVGCGGGGSLTRFIQLGFAPNNLYGIDIIKERIDEARGKYPNLHFVCDNAISMPYESNMFDLVMESTMFVQLTDEELSQKISQEMLRVTKPNGYILLIDWRYGKPRNKNYLAVSNKRITKLFSVGSLSDVVCQQKGALVPPVGRAISRYLPSAYFLLRAILPILVGSKVTLLKKRNA
jgi:ubiquinone/menaquinone biosynthesis C-methylase UbiE